MKTELRETSNKKVQCTSAKIVKLILKLVKISYENLPCIVMTRISPNCLTETRHGSIQLFCEYILMSKQCVGICEPLINLNCTLEKSDSCIMFLLQTEAVSSSTPRLKGSLAKKFPINQNSCEEGGKKIFFLSEK